MEKNGLEHDVWVLICDGRKALLTENEGDAGSPNLQVRQTLEHPDLPTREQGTDKPGRVFAGVGERRAATEPTDFHALEEESFLKGTAAQLDRAVTEGRIRKLILVAPPPALGVLRRALTPAVRKIVQREIEKDYVRMPMHEVERHLAQQLTPG
jgi:protein required for attachment to host cells